MRRAMEHGPLDAARLHRLIDAGRSLVSHLDLDALLEQLIAIAADITGARYVALGILDQERRELERFLTHGIDAEERRAIGDLPRGRGILGVLIDDPRPLRLASVGDDARSYGFPPGHPPMETLPRRAGDDPRRGLGQPLPDREGGRGAVHAPPTRRRS